MEKLTRINALQGPRDGWVDGSLPSQTVQKIALLVRELLNHGLSGRGSGGLGAPAFRAALQDVSVMEQPIQHGTDSGNIAE